MVLAVVVAVMTMMMVMVVIDDDYADNGNGGVGGGLQKHLLLFPDVGMCSQTCSFLLFPVLFMLLVKVSPCVHSLGKHFLLTHRLQLL